VAPLGAPALKGKSLPVAVFDLRALREEPVEVDEALAANEFASRR
jgi:hypothetical protein